MGLLCRQLSFAATPRRLLALNIIALLVNLLLFAAHLTPSFESTITHAQRTTMLSTLRTLVSQMEAHNITYLMMCGTLIGSYRHHGMIPWDDDIDIGFLTAKKQRIRDVLRRLEPDFKLYIPYDDLRNREPWKFYPRTSGGYLHKSFGWPYIDMFFYGENVTHIWNDRPVETQQVFRKCDVFPLRRRPFGDMMLMAPCNPRGILTAEFGDLDRCVSRSFSHILELPMPFMSHDQSCSELTHKYQFVSRTYNKTTVNETLRIGHWTVNTVSLPALCANPCPRS